MRTDLFSYRTSIGISGRRSGSRLEDGADAFEQGGSSLLETGFGVRRVGDEGAEALDQARRVAFAEALGNVAVHAGRAAQEES